MYKGKTIGVIVLAYDVEAAIRGVVEGMPDWVDRIYVVDDGSRDNTAAIVKNMIEGDSISNLKSQISKTQLTTHNSKLILIRHEVNKGPGAGLKSGYRAAIKDGLDIVVKVDGDGQMRPEQMPDLVSPIAEGKADYTKGNRLFNHAYQADMPRFRLIGNYLLTWLTRIESGYWHVSDSQNGYIAISGKVLGTIDLNFYDYYGYLNDLLAHLNIYNFRVRDIPMAAKYGKEKSKIRYRYFVTKVSLRLVRMLLWRLKTKYFIKHKRNKELLNESRNG